MFILGAYCSKICWIYCGNCYRAAIKLSANIYLTLKIIVFGVRKYVGDSTSILIKL